MVKIGSLCSGYGGLDMALEAFTGGRTVWHVEYDKHPSAILAHRFPGVPNHGDVKLTDWAQVEPVEHLTGHRGESLRIVTERVRDVCERVGVPIDSDAKSPTPPADEPAANGEDAP